MPTIPDTAPAIFQLDDGTRERAIGYGSIAGPAPAIWLNRFTPPQGAFPINLHNIYIFWPPDSGTDLLGQPIRLLVYQDTDGDDNPSNATLVGEQVVTVGVTDTFQTYPVSVTIPGPTGDIYIGFEDTWAEGF